MNAPQAVGFDAASLGTSTDADKPIWFEIVSNRDAKGTGIQFQVVGKDSKAYRTLSRKQQNRRLDELSKTRKLKMTAEQSEEEMLTLLVACVVNFRSRSMFRDEQGDLQEVVPETFIDTINIKGEALTFSAESTKRIFKTVPEIREQLEDFLHDRVNFLQGSSPA